MKYENINQVIKEFNFKTDDSTEIRKELRKLQVGIHPDKNGGHFRTKEEETRYLNIAAAIEFIDADNNKLIPLKDVTTLINTIKDLVPSTADNKLLKQEANLAQRIDSSIKREKSSHLFPKITLTSISAVLSIIWLFPTQIKEHPILGKYIDISSTGFTEFWFFSLLLTISLWAYYSIVDNQDERFKTLLKIESFQDTIFKEFLGILKHRKPEASTFTKDDFIEYVIFEVPSHSKYSYKPRMFQDLKSLLRPRRLDVEVAQNLVEIIISRLEKKELIRHDSSKKTLSDVYVLNKDFDVDSLY